MIAPVMFMLVIIGFSTFIGGVYPKYNEATVNDSFRDDYDKMSDIATKTNTLQNTLIETSSNEKSNVLTDIWNSFVFIKDTVLLLPSILVDSVSLMFGSPSDTSSGGVLYTFSGDIGIPTAVVAAIILIITILLIFSIVTAIGGWLKK